MQLATILGIDPHNYSDLYSRLAAQDDLEIAISEVTSQRDAETLATQLQYAGVEAVPVADFEDLLKSDPQLQSREHFVRLERALTGESIYERNGFRLSAARSALEQPSPLLGEHTEEILGKVLAYDADQILQLRESGAIE